MRHWEIVESTSNDVAMHQQTQDASQKVMQYIYAGHDPFREVEFGKYGDFFLYLSRDIGFDTDFHFLILIGVRQKNAIGMSGMVMKFSEPIFNCDRAIVVFGMRQHTLEDMRSMVNSTGFITVFQHEYLHLLDLIRTQERITAAKDVDPRNSAEYYNDPAEFNAYFHDVAGPMLEIIRYAEAEPQNVKDYMDLYRLTGNFQTDIETILSNFNPHIQRFTQSLTPDRRRALMRRLYRVHQRMVDVVKHDLVTEGRVYRIEWDYPRPVMVISDPSPPQARTLVKSVARDESVYIRGLMNGERVYVWDGSLMTHDDILSRLMPDIRPSSSDVTTFEISNYTVVGLQKLEYHAARCRIMKPGDLDPERSSFVRNVMTAMDQTARE